MPNNDSRQWYSARAQKEFISQREADLGRKNTAVINGLKAICIEALNAKVKAGFVAEANPSFKVYVLNLRGLPPSVQVVLSVPLHPVAV